MIPKQYFWWQGLKFGLLFIIANCSYLRNFPCNSVDRSLYIIDFCVNFSEHVLFKHVISSNKANLASICWTQHALQNLWEH